MSILESIQNQYFAALDMLKDAVTHCPPHRWDDPQSAKKFWQVVYHTLFYTHLYLQPSLESFIVWSRHREKYEELKPQAHEGTPLVSYTKEEILEYFDFCQQEVAKQTSGLDLESASGFFWLPFNKLELQIYNIRHVQNHAAELAEWLGANENIEVHWVSTRPGNANA